MNGQEQFAEGLASWRRMLGAVAEPEARLKIFIEAAGEVASYIHKGLERADAADELADMASTFLAELPADQVQSFIADAITLAEKSHAKGNGKAKEKQPPPLPYVDLAAPVVERQWLSPDLIPMFNVTLLSGEGAIGKSIALLQLSTAVVLGKPWFGKEIAPGPVLYIAAEEDEDEIRRRLQDIATHAIFDSSRDELISNGLRVLCFAGSSALLAAPDRSELMQPTPLFERIKADALALQPKLIVVDPVADVFGGKENDRAQTRMFCTMMRGLAIAAGAAVILSSHPSVAGVQTDTGLSGSTAWHNSVRARMYFKAVKDDPDKTLRILEIKKNNYGPVTATIRVHWRTGVYVQPEQISDYEEAAVEKRAEELFIKLLRDFQTQGRGNVSHKIGPTYAPAKFAETPDAKKARIFGKAFAEAMERLFAKKLIVAVEDGPKSKLRSRIVEVSNQSSNRVPTGENSLPTASNHTSDDMGNWEDDPRNSIFQPENSNQKFSNDSSGTFHPPDPLPGRTDGPESGSPDSSARHGVAQQPSRLEDHPGWKGAPQASSFHVIGSAPHDAVCMHCHESGNVKRMTDNRVVGSKSECLHERCAKAWFEKVNG